MFEFGVIFTNTLALAAICYGWLNPVFGIMVYYVFAVLRPQFLWFWAFRGDDTRFSLMVAVSTLLGWLLGGFGNWANVRAVWLPMAGFAIYLASGFLAMRVGVNPQRAWDPWYLQLKIGLMLVVALTLIQQARHVHIFGYVVCAASGYLGWVFNSQYMFDNWNRALSRGFGGVDNNGLAMMMVLGVPLCFFIGVHDKRLWVKALCFVGAACLIHTVLFSFSRGGQLGLCMVGLTLFLVALFRLPRKGLTIALAILFVALTLRLAGNEVRERFMTIFVDEQERDASAASRFDTWAAAWACMKDHPLGVGPRNFNIISNRYGLPYNKSVHNLYLQTGADYGFAGMFGLTLFYAGTLWQVLRASRTRTARRLEWPQYFCYMIAVSLAGFLVCSTFIGMESVEMAFIISLVGLCTVAFIKRAAKAEPAPELDVLPELAEVPARADDIEPAWREPRPQLPSGV